MPARDWYWLFRFAPKGSVLVSQLGKSLKYVSLSAITIGFLACVSLLIMYVTHFGRSDFSSDDAVLSLLAESIWEQGTLFPTGWIGNNGDLIMPSGVLLLAPLLSWFPNSYELHAVAGVFSVALMLGTFIVFLIRGRVPLPIVLIAATVLASGFSRISAIMVYLQTTYVWWPSAFLLGAALIWRERESRSQGGAISKYRVAVLAIIVFMVAFSNPARALIMVVFPLYVFDRILVLRLNRSLQKSHSGLIAGLGFHDLLAIVGLGAGFLLAAVGYYGLFRVGMVQTAHNSSALHWEGWSGVAAHCRIFFYGWFSYLGGDRELNAPTGMLESVLRPLRLGFAIWLTWVGIAEVTRMFRHVEPFRNALAGAFVAAMIPILFLYLMFAPLAIDLSTTRYFTVPIIILLAMAAVRVAGASRRLYWLGNPLSIVFVVFMVLVCAVRFVPGFSQKNLQILEIRDSFVTRTSRLLEHEKLSWGYATYWNAGAITILSGEKVRVNPIIFSGKEMLVFPFMTQQSHYLPSDYSGETFFLLDTWEATAERKAAMSALLGEPSRIIQKDDAVVYVYPTNISSHICSMGRTMDVALSPSANHGRVIRVAHSAHTNGAVGQRVSVVVSNDGSEVLGGTGRYPISIGIRLMHGDGSLIAPDWAHFPLPCAVPPGEEREFVFELPELPTDSQFAKVGLVQEGIAWFDQWGIEPATILLEKPREGRLSSNGFEQH